MIFTGVVLRVVSLAFSQNCGGDAAERIGLTAQWLKHPTRQLVFLVYPAGHFWLMAAMAAIIPDVVTAGRLLSFALGVASLFLVFRLARLLYGDYAASLSLAVFALYSLHIGYCTTSSSEGPQVFFLLLALLLFFSYFDDDDRPVWKLAVSGFSLTVAESIRFEPWIVFAALVFVFPYLWTRMRGTGNMPAAWFGPFSAFCVIAAIWPVTIMLYCWRKFGAPLYLISDTQARMSHVLASAGHHRLYELALIPAVLFFSLSATAIAGVVYALAIARRGPMQMAFAAIPLFLLAVQEFQVLRGSVLVVARYSLTPGALLCVIAGDGLEAICEKLSPMRTSLARIGVVALLIVNLSAIWLVSDIPNPLADRVAPFAPRLRYQTRIQQVGDFLRAHLTATDAVVIDDYNVESNWIAQAAGLPFTRDERVYLMSSKQTIGVEQYIQSEHPRFVVYSDQGTLPNDFSLPKNCVQTAMVGNIGFQCLFANNIYRVYELSYPASAPTLSSPETIAQQPGSKK